MAHGAGGLDQIQYVPIDTANSSVYYPTRSCIPPRTASVITGVVLGVLAGIAAYYLFSYGFQRLDLARTRFDIFVGGTCAYMGVAFACAAVGNLVYALLRTSCCARDLDRVAAEDCGGEGKCLSGQITTTLLAPLLFLPMAVVGGSCLALGGK